MGESLPNSNERLPQCSNPPDPNTSVTLPPEILDEILEYVFKNGEGQRTLIACALVAAWWAGPSQRHLFSSVDIGDSNYERWMNGVVLPEPKTRLLGHVRSLGHHRTQDIGVKYRMRDLAQDSGKYLSALPNLHSLTLGDTAVEHLSEEEFRNCFSAFRETLTFLSLDSFTTSFSAFVILVDYFPNITTLRVEWFILGPDERPVPSLSRPLRGKLHAHNVGDHCSEFFDQVAKLDVEYEELVTSCSTTLFHWTDVLKSFLRISTSTVKFLRLIAELQCE